MYDADKVWRRLRRENFSAARCAVELLMRRQGLRGVVLGKSVSTMVPDAKAACTLDRNNRELRAERPTQLWLRDFSAPWRHGLQRRQQHRRTQPQRIEAA